MLGLFPICIMLPTDIELTLMLADAVLENIAPVVCLLADKMPFVL